MNNELHPDTFKIECKRNNLKITPQREVIYRVLMTSKDHPSADVVHKKLGVNFPNISLDTVNRTLQTFSKIGLIRTVESSGEPKRYDPDNTIHHHLKCIKCETIFDFNHKEYDALEIPSRISSKYVILNKRVVLEIICDKCEKHG